MQEFFMGAGFSTSLARRKIFEQLGSLGGAVSPPQWDTETKTRKILAIFHFEELKTSLSWLCNNEW